MPLPVAPSQDPSRGKLRRAILAVDYGRSRIGLALSDESELTARPLGILRRTNRRSDAARLREMCRLHSVGRIVIGWPIRLDGSPGTMAAEASQFAERLRKELGLPVELLDERLSSWEAGRLANATKSRGKASPRKREALDDVAAAVILRDYLSRAPRGERG